mmetsp:Transcript_93973/g.239244  ORF Transcript_93973/g.239244 Transcript_93973/m.239244 type:complete len:105 (-) Transcript_93973:203-517(-)
MLASTLLVTEANMGILQAIHRTPHSKATGMIPLCSWRVSSGAPDKNHVAGWWITLECSILQQQIFCTPCKKGGMLRHARSSSTVRWQAQAATNHAEVLDSEEDT